MRLEPVLRRRGPRPTAALELLNDRHRSGARLRLVARATELSRDAVDKVMEVAMLLVTLSKGEFEA